MPLTPPLTNLSIHKNSFGFYAGFNAFVAVGSNIYQGRDIREAHAGLAITDDHFDRLLAHLDAATHMLGIEPGDIETLLDIVRSTRDDVVMV